MMKQPFKDYIDNLYKTRTVTGPTGKEHSLHSEIDAQEGALIFNTINNDPTVLKTLEVGCAYGMSTLHICAGLQGRTGAHHTILEPNMYLWDEVCPTNLKRCGVDYFTLREEFSEFAMPSLLKNNEGSFDFILVDGWHSFDHTLVDCFYATRLLRVGGYLVVDDVAHFPAVKRAVDFISTYPCYQLAGSVPQPKGPPFMVALKKIGPDARGWDWHDDTPWTSQAHKGAEGAEKKRFAFWKRAKKK